MTGNTVPRLLFVAALASWLGACSGGEPAPVAVAATAERCDRQGRLATEIYGALRASIDWQSTDLDCEGMARPDGEGARLRFAGALPDGGQLAIIIGLPDIEAGQAARELPSNVTVIEEGKGRFFATRGAGACWADIERNELLDAPGGRDYRVSGVLYCVSPLTDPGGETSISFADLSFSGRLNWENP